jgi:type IX secretion system PorP/SprF family membrane protein
MQVNSNYDMNLQKLRLRNYCILAIGYCLLNVAAASAQDIHFSQFYMSPLTLNPATAGAFKDITATTIYREQWQAVSSPYQTFAIAGDMRLMKAKWKSGYLGVGLNVFSDKAGDGSLSTTQVNLNLAAHVKLDANQTLSGGLQAGFGQYSINLNNLTWDNNYNQATGVVTPGMGTSGEIGKIASTSILYPDIGAGMLYQYNKGESYISGNDVFQSNFGVAVAHINQPTQSFYASSSGTDNDVLFMKYTVHGMLLIGLKNTPISINPSFVYYRQGPAQEITAGSLIKYTLKEDSKYTGYVRGAAISLGAFYRWDDAVIISSLLEMGNYAIGLSYDVNISELSTVSEGRGGFELSLRYVNPSNFLYQNKARF